MSQLKNTRLIRALLRQSVDRTPVWLMRQAGRYLPEYREIRQQAGSFMDLATNPELACEVTLQPLRRYPQLDAAILFSDILTIPDAMGLGLYFTSGEGPQFTRVIRQQSDIDQLKPVEPERNLRYVIDAVATIHRALAGSVPLIGFSGSPWTLAAYMIQGRGSRDFAVAKSMLYQAPELAHQLLQKLANAVIDYLNAQIEAGVNAVQIFDTWGGLLSARHFREFSLAYIQQIIAGLNLGRGEERIPVIVFCKGCAVHLEAIADSGCDALGLDWTITLQEARQRVGERVALQGNLDPSALYASPEVIRQQAKQVLASYGSGNGHVFNLGHGMAPDMQPEHVAALLEAIQEFSPGYHL